MRRAWSLWLRLVLGLCLSLATSLEPAFPARAAGAFAIIDTLGVATPATAFGVFGASGYALSARQYAGPAFTLARASVLTEIGAFLSGCGRLSQGACAPTAPFAVQIRPSVDGLPDPSTVVASLLLSRHADPQAISYRSVA